MLPGEDFGRRQQRRLCPGLHRDQHRFERDHRLAGTDIALQQPQHRRFLRHIAFYFRDRSGLRPGQRERQGELAPIAAVSPQRLALALAIVRTHQHQREAVGKEFIIGQPIARIPVVRLVRLSDRFAP